MRRFSRRFLAVPAACAPAAALVVAACTGDDEVYRDTGRDGGPGGDVVLAPDGPGSTPPDGGARGASCGDAAGAPPRALVVYATPRTSELTAVNLETSAVDGRLAFASSYAVTSSTSDPYLLAQETDIVSRLDAREPWRVVSSWNVRGDDKNPQDGGPANANPSGIVVPSCGKAYVLRFNRNRIAVLDTTQPTDAGAPTKYIDLSALVAAGDQDRVVEMTSAVYVPSKKRVYVLLGNIDLTKIYKPDPVTTRLLCSSATAPSIIAIDIETDAVVSLGGSAPGGGIALKGYNPPGGSPLWYDAARDRLLVLHAGCNADVLGIAGEMTKRGVEEVDLATGQTRELVSFNDKGFPSTLAFADATHAAVAFYGEAYFWDPTKTTLGPAIPGGLDVVTIDGKSAFVGTRQVYGVGFVPGPLQVVRVPFDAGQAVVEENPQTAEAGTGYVSSVEVWPRP